MDSIEPANMRTLLVADATVKRTWVPVPVALLFWTIPPAPTRYTTALDSRFMIGLDAATLLEKL